jgi:ribosome-associated protein
MEEFVTGKAPVPRNAPAAVDDAPERMLALILTALEENQAESVMQVDLRGKSSVADYMVIASGRSARHVGAMAEDVPRRLRDLGVHVGQIEGYPQCDWALVDGGDVIVHLFRPEVRAFYALEKMWGLEPPPLPDPGLSAEPLVGSSVFTPFPIR